MCCLFLVFSWCFVMFFINMIVLCSLVLFFERLPFPLFVVSLFDLVLVRCPSFLCALLPCSLFLFLYVESVVVFGWWHLFLIVRSWPCSLCVVLGCCCGVLLFLLILCSLTLILFFVRVCALCSSCWLSWFVIVLCPWTFICYGYKSLLLVC